MTIDAVTEPETICGDEGCELIALLLQSGWSAFVIDMNERVGLPLPDIDFRTGHDHSLTLSGASRTGA